MFTGIVQDVGRIVSLERREGDVRLRIAVTHLQLDHTSPGDSIAVSGVCLTALDLDKTPGAQSFAADVSNETLSLTTLGHLVGWFTRQSRTGSEGRRCSRRTSGLWARRWLG